MKAPRGTRAADELTDLTDAELMRRVSRGDRTAFTILYRRHAPFLARLMSLRYPWIGHQQAEDILQDLFLRLWQKRDQRFTVRSLAAYLRQMLHGLVVDALRRSDIRKSQVISPNMPCRMPTPPEMLTHEESMDAIAARVQKLSLLQQRTFCLKLTGRPAVQIADLEECTVNAVKQRNRQARAKLSRMLARCGDACVHERGNNGKCPATHEDVECLKYSYFHEIRHRQENGDLS